MHWWPLTHRLRRNHSDHDGKLSKNSRTTSGWMEAMTPGLNISSEHASLDNLEFVSARYAAVPNEGSRISGPVVSAVESSAASGAGRISSPLVQRSFGVAIADSSASRARAVRI